VAALQVWSPEFKPQSYQTQNNTNKQNNLIEQLVWLLSTHKETEAERG
jgi:hypothetical protein